MGRAQANVCLSTAVLNQIASNRKGSSLPHHEYWLVGKEYSLMKN